jgi:hypothetical protein
MDWSNRFLIDSNDVTTVDWGNKVLYASDGSTQIDWSNSSYMQLPSISESSITNILGIDGSGRLYYTASSAIGGGGGGPAFPFNGNAVITGSLLVSGSSGGLSGITGSLQGTSSWATNAVTSSYVDLGVNAGTSQFLRRDNSDSNVYLQGRRLDISGSQSTLIQGGGNSIDINSSNISFNGTVALPVATYSITASQATTASYVTGSIFTSANPALTASHALTASFVRTVQTASYVTGSIFTSANPALSASYALTAVTSSKVLILSGSISGLTYIYGGLEGSGSTGIDRNIQTTALTYNTNTRLLNASSSFALTASYVVGSIFTNENLALSASQALTASFSPNFANTNLTLTTTRTHNGNGFRYRFLNSGSTSDNRGGHQLIDSAQHILGIRELKGGGGYDSSYISITPSILAINVGDEDNNIRQLTITTSSVSISASLNIGSAVTMPNRSAFRVYGASVTGIPATTTISGSATTVDYNQNNNYNNTTGLFTAPLTGLYHVYYNGRTNSGTTQQVIIYKNRVAGVGGTAMMMWETTGSNSGHFGINSILNLATNDTLQAVVSLGTIQFDSNDNWGVAYIG